MHALTIYNQAGKKNRGVTSHNTHQLFFSDPLPVLGIIGEWYVRRMYDPAFYINVTSELDQIFERKYKKNVSDYILALMEPKLGKPIHDMLV